MKIMADSLTSDPEKAAGLTTSQPLPDDNKNSPPHIKHHHLHARARLRHFLHPSGTRFHVADSPIEASQIQHQLSTQASSEPFTICISGSPEHLSAVRESHSHHEAKQAELRDQHGEVWKQFSHVQSELDALSRELGRVASKGVSLEGHFGRFGYDAKIRSYDGDDGSGRDDASSLEGREAEPLKLFKVPVVRQYFHKGILWRASTSEEVRSFELFVDLLYVGIIAINGDAAAEHPDGYSLLKFISKYLTCFRVLGSKRWQGW